jgi:hypothetical protein
LIDLKDLIDGALGYSRISDFVIINAECLKDEILEKDAIICCSTNIVPSLFNFIKNSNRKYILITQFCDLHINESNDQRTSMDSILFDTKPKCIKKWYAPTTTFHHPDLIQIPLGFGIHWDIPNYPKCNEEYRNWIFNNSENLFYTKKNLEVLYCNYVVDSYRSYRFPVMNKLLSNNMLCYTPTKMTSGTWNLSFIDYCKDMSKFKFVISPPGNAIETHRNWEALYMGCIPIVIGNIPKEFTNNGKVKGINIYENYDLPFLIIEDYSEVTTQLLKNYLDYYNNHEFKYEQMTLSYWKNKMLYDLYN